MHRWLSTLVLLLTSLPALASPAQAIAYSHADIKRVPEPERVYTRYHWIGHLPAPVRERWTRVLFAHYQFVSRHPKITCPPVILADGTLRKWPAIAEKDWPEIVMLRLNILNYKWSAKTYDKLAEQDFDFHVLLEYDYGYYNDPINKHGWVQTKTVVEPAAAFWFNAKQIADLINWTQSVIPVMYGDEFLWQTVVANDRIVGYYNMLGVTDRDSFFKLVGFDQKASERFSFEMLAAVANSGVSRQPRRISRHDKIKGAIWRTYDNRLAADGRNPLRLLDDEIFVFDAEEDLAHLPNGIIAGGLFQGNGDKNVKEGTLQKVAPQFVGFDKTSHDNNGDIEVILSCIRCHRNGLLQPIRSWQQNVYKAPGKLRSYSPDKIEELQQKYFRSLEAPLADDRLIYARALAEASGFTPEKYAAALATCWDEITTPVGLERAARILGTTPAKLVAALDAANEASGITDSVLGIYQKPLVEQEPIPLDQWHEVVPIAHAALLGLPIPAKVKVPRSSVKYWTDLRSGKKAG